MTSGPAAKNLDLLTRAAAAEHIAIDASRLARMANANELPHLAHLLDMAVLEAWRAASGPEREEPGAT